MSRYFIAIPAKQDLKEINSYIARYNSTAARSFKERIKQQCKLLADFPEMGQNRDELEPGLRSFSIENYLIFYRPIASGVEIIRVVSGYRDLEAIFSNEETD
ncbi:MAG: type II toxin-antitoxin system RelE/ParE family toxin [Okeania sp. SIO2H7]|nr:type II toxin-antitoxin system RelE/ParE family toxin [Okeania sp. SIO2H7]